MYIIHNLKIKTSLSIRLSVILPGVYYNLISNFVYSDPAGVLEVKIWTGEFHSLVHHHYLLDSQGLKMKWHIKSEGSREEGLSSPWKSGGLFSHCLLSGSFHLVNSLVPRKNLGTFRAGITLDFWPGSACHPPHLASLMTLWLFVSL